MGGRAGERGRRQRPSTPPIVFRSHRGGEGEEEKEEEEKEEEDEEEDEEEEEEKEKEKEKEEKTARASNGQRYPLPCCTHFGNLKCAQQGKGYC